MLAHEAAELERHAVAGGELQIGDSRAAPRWSVRRVAGKAPRVQSRQRAERRAARLDDRRRRVIGAEELILIVFVERHQARDPAPEARMACERAMLGSRELQAQLRRLASTASEGRARQQKMVDVLTGCLLRAMYFRRITLR